MGLLDKPVGWVKANPGSTVGGFGGLGAVVALVLYLMPPSFPAPEGHRFTLAPLPEFVGADGWVDADRLASFLRDAIDRTVGAPLSTGSGSYALRRWKDKRSDGIAYEVRAGIWATGFHEAPAGNPVARRRAKIRYWIERHEDRQPPGEYHLAIVAFAQASADAHEFELNHLQTESALADFFALLDAP